MSESSPRPGGLTALAIINFVFAPLSLLSVLSAIVFPSFVDMIPTQSPEDRQLLEQTAAIMRDPGVRLVKSLEIIPAALLVISGIGYLRQKRLQGRVIGSVYAVCAIAIVIAQSLAIKLPHGGGMLLGYAIGFIYPLLTLFFVNVTFKDDLIN